MVALLGLEYLFFAPLHLNTCSLRPQECLMKTPHGFSDQGSLTAPYHIRRYHQVYVVGDVGIEEELDLIGVPHFGGPKVLLLAVCLLSCSKQQNRVAFRVHHQTWVKTLRRRFCVLSKRLETALIFLPRASVRYYV